MPLSLIVQRFNEPRAAGFPGTWETVLNTTSPFFAFAQVGLLKYENTRVSAVDRRPVRLVEEATNQHVPAPNVTELISWMYLLGKYPLGAIDQTCAYIESLVPQPFIPAATSQYAEAA